MNFQLETILLAVGLFCGMIFLMELGRRIGQARKARDPEAAHKGIGAVEGAVFALLGLIIAFTFSGALSRFNDRRLLVGEESNAIGTAYLRVGLLPRETQPEIQALFRHYVDVRWDTYHHMDDKAALRKKLAEADALQKEIWSKSLSACGRPDAPAQATLLLLPALNAMIDITTTRIVATQEHPPMVVFWLLCILALAGALLAGYGMSESRGRSLIHMIFFAVAISITVFVIIDLEYPRSGLIRIDSADQVLYDLRQSMN